ncbi:MAG: hypothetical protein ACPGUV_03660 [Polyangiales bacterium]
MALWVAMGGSACAGHAARTATARDALDRGRPRLALSALNQALGVQAASELPAQLDDAKLLFVLDRAMVLQQTGLHRWSSRDLEVADKGIEILDFSRKKVHEMGRYLFSDDTGPYRAPAYEKLLINTFNMLNYLVRRDLSGARVEARRFTVMRRFLRGKDGKVPPIAALGSQLAGFVFEKSGATNEALRHYADALAHSRIAALQGPVRSLTGEVQPRDPVLRRTLADAARCLPAAPTDASTAAPPAASNPPDTQPKAPSTASGDSAPRAAVIGRGAALQSAPLRCPPAPHPRCLAGEPCGEMLVWVASGRVPAKVARRMPIGLALTFASPFLSPYNQTRARRMAAQGLVTWVNFPELAPLGGPYAMPRVHINGQRFAVESVAAIDQSAYDTWQGHRGTIIAAALVRTLARAAVGEGARRVTGGGTLGTLLSLGSQAALTARDTPDTRSWATLPARVHLLRLRLPAGHYRIHTAARGYRRAFRVRLAANDWAVVSLTALR